MVATVTWSSSSDFWFKISFLRKKIVWFYLQVRKLFRKLFFKIYADIVIKEISCKLNRENFDKITNYYKILSQKSGCGVQWVPVTRWLPIEENHHQSILIEYETGNFPNHNQMDGLQHATHYFRDIMTGHMTTCSDKQNIASLWKSGFGQLGLILGGEPWDCLRSDCRRW